MDIRLRAQMQRSGESGKEVFIRDTQKGFDENLRFDGADRRGFEGIAPKWVIRFGHERVAAKKLSRRKQADNRLAFVTVERDPGNTGDEQVNEPRLLVLRKNNFIFFEVSYGKTIGELV